MIKKNLFKTVKGLAIAGAVALAIGLGTGMTDKAQGFNEFTTTVYASENNAIYNGIDYSAVFDAKYYYINNADVANALGYNPDALLWHFVEFGMAEGRCASADFNVVQYMYGLLNDDLRAAFGGDMKQYYYHYMNYGRYEGRSISDWDEVFSPRNYLNENPDVYENIVSRFTSDGNTFGWALWHFCEYGANEGRSCGSDFSLQGYMECNPDLISAYGNDYKQYYIHYIQNGKAEGRKYKVDSNDTSDSNTSDNDVNNNYDTSNDTNNDTITSTLTVYNGVDYADVYDYNYYISTYDDISFLNEKDAISHFINFGISEGRQACENFNVRIYRFENDDLKAVYGDNLMGYVEHYMTNGKNENRNATVIDKDVHFTREDMYRTDTLYYPKDYMYELFFSKTDLINKLMTNEEIFKKLAYFDYCRMADYEADYDITGICNEVEGLVYDCGVRWSMDKPFFSLMQSLNACGYWGDNDTMGFGDEVHSVSLDVYLAKINGVTYYTLQADSLYWENDGYGYDLKWDSFLMWTKEEIDNWVNTHPNALIR